MDPIPLLITLRPHLNPYRPPSSPLNQGQCLSVSKADSIDFRNHSISFSSSHRLTTKEKKPTLYTHHKRKKQTSLTHHKMKKHFISHPAPLVVPNNPKSYLFHPLPLLVFLFVYTAVLLSIFPLFRNTFDGQKIFGCCRK